MNIARPIRSSAFLATAALCSIAASSRASAQSAIDIAVVFTPAAIQTIESSEFGSIDTREEWIDKHMGWANDGLRHNDLDDNAEFVAVNEQTGGMEIDITEGNLSYEEIAKLYKCRIYPTVRISGMTFRQPLAAAR